MLRKLLKYEVMATGRTFLPLFGALLVFALINKVISAISPNELILPRVLSMIIYVTVLVGMCVMTIVVMIQRFYKNLLSDEGYLMFTLPAKPWKHIASKLLVSMMWSAASFIVAVLSVLIVGFGKIFNPAFMQTVSYSISEFFRFFGVSSVFFIVEFLLACVISLASSILMIYASIALGHLVSRHKVLASLGALLALNTISQILFAIVSIIPGSMEFFRHTSNLNSLNSAVPLIHFVLWYCSIFTGVLSVGYFIVANYILSRHLNLE